MKNVSPNRFPPSTSRSVTGTPGVLMISVFSLAIAGCAHTAEFSAYTQSLIQRVAEIKAQRGQLLLSEQERDELGAGADNRVRGSLQVEGVVDTVMLERLGVAVESRLGTIWTARIPLESLERLGGVRGVKYIEIIPPARPRTDALEPDLPSRDLHVPQIIIKEIRA